MGWTKLWPIPVKWSEERDVRGSALVVLPIKLVATAVGQEVTVPHSVIQVETPVIEDGRSTAFSNSSGRWVDETTIAMSVPMRFHLPPQVCPIEATEVICDMQLRAPQREVTIESAATGAAQNVALLRSPLAAERFRITDPAVLADAADGVLDFRVTICDCIGRDKNDRTVQVGPWQIDYFRISVKGRVAPR